MNLKEILEKHNITNITTNSVEAMEGVAFVAIKGLKFDGNDFIPDVIAKNCNLIFTDSDITKIKYQNDDNIILVKNARKILAELAVTIWPEAPEFLYGITGTNGKSSVVHYIAQLLAFNSINSATLGTLGRKIYKHDNNSVIIDTKDIGLTTSDPISLNKELSDLKKNKIEHAAIEISSIGLEQHRPYGRRYHLTGFTSFSQDHLDYHKDMDAYLKEKLKLFSPDYQDFDGVAIINRDIYCFEEIETYLKSIGRNYYTYGSRGDFKINILSSSIKGQNFAITYLGKDYKFFTKVIGVFQVYNIALALIMIHISGIKFEEMEKFVAFLDAPTGRLERVSSDNIGSRIFIDYAHSPDALDNVLKELKKLKKDQSSKLIVVFGCGGDRDSIKRPIMGNIASENADIIIITDDNPRNENPDDIRKDIIRNHSNFIEISDREKAIEFAISKMDQSDILLIAGKGHEEYQIIGNNKIYFSDKHVAKSLI